MWKNSRMFHPCCSPFIALKMLLLCSAVHTASSSLSAIQANFGGVTYAGGMSYDETHDVVYVTGQVGANGCFVGLLKDFTWISRHILPEPAICQSLFIEPKNAQQVYLAAATEEGGLYTDTRVMGSDRSELYGLAMTLDLAANGNSAQLSGTRHALLHLNPVQYPRSMTVDSEKGEYIYVLSMDSEDKSALGVSGEEIPNLTPGGIAQYGSAYTMTVTKLVKDNFVVVWEKEFGPHSTQTGNLEASVEVSQMIYQKDALMIVGSTRGSGPAFGQSESETNFHGFITKIDPGTGHLWEPEGGNDNAKTLKMISLGASEDVDTIIMGVCSASDKDDYVYIVGMYHPEGVAAPFMAKLNADTLEIVWMQKLDERSTNAYGLACGVDSSYAYMAGIVENDGVIAHGITSNGGDDVFVLQLSLEDGSVQWKKQIGTKGDDRLAHGGTGLLVTDNGILLYGDTSGNMYSTAEHSFEMFVSRVGLDGKIPDTAEATGIVNSGGTIPIVTPPRMDIDQDDDEVDETAPPRPNIVPPPSTAKLEKGSGSIGIFVVALILAGIFAAGYFIQKSRDYEGTDRALVFSYLQAFDIDDVDVRHSATGGWHGTYVGKLAQGQGGSDRLGSASHSSIVKDSLFVDYETATPSLGSNDSTDQGSEDDVDRYIDGALSFADRKANLTSKSSDSGDPWGKDII